MFDNQDLDDTRCTPESEREKMQATIARLEYENVGLRERAEGLAREVEAKREHFLNPSVATLQLVNQAEIATDAAGWLKPKEAP